MHTKLNSDQRWKLLVTVNEFLQTYPQIFQRRCKPTESRSGASKFDGRTKRQWHSIGATRISKDSDILSGQHGYQKTRTYFRRKNCQLNLKGKCQEQCPNCFYIIYNLTKLYFFVNATLDNLSFPALGPFKSGLGFCREKTIFARTVATLAKTYKMHV